VSHSTYDDWHARPQALPSAVLYRGITGMAVCFSSVQPSGMKDNTSSNAGILINLFIQHDNSILIAIL
jgi:hypothetical protein